MPRTRDPKIVEVEDRFRFHPATETTGPQHDAVRSAFGKLAVQMQKTLPDGRHKSLALTALEESMHWANAAIAVGGATAPAVQVSDQTPVSVEPKRRGRPRKQVAETPVSAGGGRKSRKP